MGYVVYIVVVPREAAVLAFWTRRTTACAEDAVALSIVYIITAYSDTVGTNNAFAQSTLGGICFLFHTTGTKKPFRTRGALRQTI